MTTDGMFLWIDSPLSLDRCAHGFAGTAVPKPAFADVQLLAFCADAAITFTIVLRQLRADGMETVHDAA